MLAACFFSENHTHNKAVSFQTCQYIHIRHQVLQLLGSRERRRLSVIATVAGAPLEEVQAAMCRPDQQSMKSGADAGDAAAGGLPSSSVTQVDATWVDL